MKKSNYNLLIFAVSLLLGFVLLYGCTHDDQEFDIYEPEPIPVPASNELVSIFATTAPIIDGTIDAAWDNATKMFTSTEVPDLENAVFAGYEGNKNEVVMRSMYDSENIYFLCEWSDAEQSFNRQTWYFNTSEGAWKQEARVPIFNSNGVQIRKPFYEDKFAFLFNVNNSVANWDAQTCFASCHTNVGEAGGFARHYTQPGESIDMWHWKGVRTNINNQADDQYQNETQPNGRHGDNKEAGGYTNNVQDMIVTGTTETVKVPKYFIPAKNYYYWITQSEIDAGTAKLITSVDASGVLGYDGGTIDPTDPEFQREGSTTGSKCIPSVYTREFVGSRGDIEAKGVFMGTGWVLELKRKLTTGDTDGQDVNFITKETFSFGIAVFDNAGIAHGIKPGLKLKFDE